MNCFFFFWRAPGGARVLDFARGSVRARVRARRSAKVEVRSQAEGRGMWGRDCRGLRKAPRGGCRDQCRSLPPTAVATRMRSLRCSGVCKGTRLCASRETPHGACGDAFRATGGELLQRRTTNQHHDGAAEDLHRPPAGLERAARGLRAVRTRIRKHLGARATVVNVHRTDIPKGDHRASGSAADWQITP